MFEVKNQNQKFMILAQDKTYLNMVNKTTLYRQDFGFDLLEHAANFVNWLKVAFTFLANWKKSCKESLVSDNNVIVEVVQNTLPAHKIINFHSWGNSGAH